MLNSQSGSVRKVVTWLQCFSLNSFKLKAYRKEKDSLLREQILELTLIDLLGSWAHSLILHQSW